MIHKTFLSALVTLVVAILTIDSVGEAGEKDWPAYRGPAGDGYAIGADLPLSFDESMVKWSTPIHGKGWSSPVVWGNQIWLTTATPDGKKMSVLCIEKSTGKVLVDRVVKENAEPAFCHKMNSYASPTPVVTEQHVFVHFGTYLTASLDKNTGEPIWERTDIPCDHHRGPASSPIFYDGKLFVAYDGFDVQFVVALDAKTGKTVWRKDRKIDYGTDNGDWMKAYCTGQIVPVGESMQLVYPSASATIAYDPKSGDELWRVYHGGMNASARPVFDRHRVYLTNGMGAMVAVNLGGKGDVTDSHIAWDSKVSIAKKSSQLVIDGLFYMITDDGIVTCRQCDSGDILWKERLEGEYAASPIFSGKHIYFFSRDGDINVVRPGKEFELAGKSKLGEGFMASPAVSGSTLILRGISKLYAVEK